MNPTADHHRPPPLHPHRPSFSCDLHPTEKFNGFCPSCLCDRLTTLHPSSSSSAATSSLFRRTKSFSASNHQNVTFEPQRRSCDVRVRVPPHQTLANNAGEEIRVFEEKGKVRAPIEDPIGLIEEKSRVRVSIEAGRARILGHSVGDKIRAFEERISPIEEKTRVRNPIKASNAQTLAQNVSNEIRSQIEGEIRVRVPIEAGGDRTGDGNVGGEIRAFEEKIFPIEEQSRVRVPIGADGAQNLAHNVGDEIRAFEANEKMKSMRDFIDLDFPAKKKKPSVGFWSAASVFSKKWNKWVKKQKSKKQNSVLSPEKPTPWRHRETQSEAADYGFGRRSCDTDPRFSIDNGRISIDGPRPSFDPPRASWDGHMIRRNNLSGYRTPIVQTFPGDSLQTHQYYLDTSSRRKRSFDKSGSKNSNLVIGTEVDEITFGLNAKVTPEIFDFHQRKSNSNSLRDECSEIFELGIRDDGSVIGGNVEEKGSKRAGKWSKRWSFWGFIYRRNKYNEDDRSSGRNSFDRSSIRGDNGNMYRRSSSVSLANSYNTGGFSGSVRNQRVENGLVRNKKRDDLILERNRSVDNGLLRFYLTPPRSNNRVSGSRKSNKRDNSRPIPRVVYRY